MSEYPKKLVSDEGGVAMVNEAKDEATLKAMGYKDAPNQADEEGQKPIAPPPNPKPKGRPRKS